MATKPIATGTRISVAEFLDIPDAGDRRKMELDDGQLYIMPRARIVHQFLMAQLFLHIANYIDSFTQPPAAVYVDPVTVFSREPRYILVPDLAIVLSGRPNLIVGGYLEGIPDVVVEILSRDRNRDLVRKRQIYAGAGVSEYWIFDPRDDTALLLELRGSDYSSRGLLTSSDTLTTPLLPGLAVPLADVFRHRQRPVDD